MSKPRSSKAPAKPLFSCEKGVSQNVVTVRIKGSTNSEHVFLLRGDAHHDNPDCDIELELQHLQQAKDRGAGIIDVGDLFCAMQGKFDKRSNKSKVRPEHQNGDYLDSLVRTAADFYEPFAHNWISFGQGNHESSICSKLETNLTERLTQVLRDRTGAPCLITGYTGWIRFLIGLSGTSTVSTTLWHTHGYGGGGPVTSDVIQGHRQRAYVEGADIMMSGHTHDRWLKEDTKLKLSPDGEVKHIPIWYVKTPTYKNEYGSGVGGFPIEKGHPPKPIGAWWLTLRPMRKRDKGKERTFMDIELVPTSRNR